MLSLMIPFLALATTVLSGPFHHNEDRGSSFALDVELDQALTLERRGSTTLQDCLAAGNVPVRFASSNDFSTLAQPYNLRLAYTPLVIVLPTTTQHVSAAVGCAWTGSIKVQAKSGGHSYASFSSGGQDGSMIIDLESFQSVSVNSSGIATVGAGVRLGNMALQLYSQAKRALPHGTCPGVGIGGHATHGGFGYSSRAWGLTLDTIVGMDVILANGSYVHVSPDQYPDLWYAMRGDAADFGIVITFYLQTQPAPDKVVNWQYNLPSMFHDAIASAVVFQHIQDFALNASVVDRNLGLGVYLDGNTFYISGTYFGDLATFNDKIAPELLRGLPEPSWTNTHSLSWLDSLTALANYQPLQQPTTGYNVHDDFFAKSVVTPSAHPLTAAALNSYFQYIIQNGVNNNSNGPWFSIMNLYGGPGSQINAVPSSSSAYSDRSALWVVQHYGRTENTNAAFPNTSVDFVDGLNNALTSLMAQDGVQFGAYQNYVDPSLTAEQAHQLYYGSDTYQRLVTIKQQVDPGRVFWNPQSVGN